MELRDAITLLVVGDRHTSDKLTAIADAAGGRLILLHANHDLPTQLVREVRAVAGAERPRSPDTHCVSSGGTPAGSREVGYSASVSVRSTTASAPSASPRLP